MTTTGQVADFANALDRRNLGTLGGGNHFIEIQKSDAGFIWLMIHSGSRNLGKRVEELYHRKAQRLNALYRVTLADPDLAFLPIREQEGHDYFRDMLFALRYAQENRRRMMAVFKETLTEFVPETEFLREVNIHHNYAAFEEHFGETLCIHRKGATSAKSGEIGIIPGSMGTASYIVRGLGNPESFMSCSHGAGRRMSPDRRPAPRSPWRSAMRRWRESPADAGSPTGSTARPKAVLTSPKRLRPIRRSTK